MDSTMKWQEEFLAYVSGLNLPRDDYKGIIGYIEEVPTIEPEILACGEGELNVPEWDEMIVICDCCGHAIHVKRQ